MSLKIDGIAGGKHPHLKKGDVIELSPEKKVSLAAKEAITKNSPEGFRFIPMGTKLIGDVQVIKGRTDIKDPEPNQFIATLEVTYRSLNQLKDRLYHPKTTKVKVHCKDCKSDIGVPDLELVSFDIVK